MGTFCFDPCNDDMRCVLARVVSKMTFADLSGVADELFECGLTEEKTDAIDVAQILSAWAGAVLEVKPES